MHGEFELPTHRLNDARRGDLLAICIAKCHFNMRPFLEWRNLDINAQTITIRIRLSSERCNMRLLGGHALQVIFRKEKFHSYSSCCQSIRLLIEEERRFSIKPYPFFLDAFSDPLLEILLFIFNRLST